MESDRQFNKRSPFNRLLRRRAANYFCVRSTEEQIAAGNAKRCSQCENVFTIESFYRKLANSEVRQPLCKRCHYDRDRSRRPKKFGALYADQVIGQIECADRFFDPVIDESVIGRDRWDYDEFGQEMSDADLEDLGNMESLS